MNIHKLLNRYGHSLSVLDLSTWPDVARELLPPGAIERYDRLKAAIVRLVTDRISHVAAARIANVDTKEIPRVLDRCFQTAPDGRIYGFRTLVKGLRQKDYERRRETQGGTAGLLALLFDQYPKVKKDVLARYKKHEPLNAIHREMLKALATAGVAPFAYPFNTSRKGREALRLYLKRYQKASRGEPPEPEIEPPKPKRTIIRPYQRVEIDAHRCDAIFVITVEGPDGVPRVVTLERIWLIVLIEVASRAVLGYALSLNRQCGIEDVLAAVQRAVVPMPRLDLTIPGLVYDPDAGFPNQLLTVCAYRLFDTLALDNALAHLSDRLHQRLNEGTQCTINLGRAGDCDARPFVERFFGTLTARGMKRMPSTTGSGPNDPRRNNPEEKAERYEFQFSEAEQLLDVLMANYNAEVHSGINCVPLDYLRRYHREIPAIYRTVPAAEREHWSLKHMWVDATIRGKDKTPYVQYQGVEYRNQALISNPGLIGKKVSLRVNLDDLRVIEIFLNGGSLGKLRAAGRWALTKHSLKTRQLILKLVKDKEIHLDGQDPVVATTQHLERKAASNRKAANQLERLRRETGESPAEPKDEASKENTPSNGSRPETDDWVPLRKPLSK